MPRRVIREKSCFFAGCEGSTEQAYIDILKNKFGDVATFLYPKTPGAA